ncbi:MAG: hypothetical protein JSR71_02555 [Proteobacteria bacterium]|nr:hypothetical protein [Pseudomonadota bacterium]
MAIAPFQEAQGELFSKNLCFALYSGFPSTYRLSPEQVDKNFPPLFLAIQSRLMHLVTLKFPFLGVAVNQATGERFGMLQYGC